MPVTIIRADVSHAANIATIGKKSFRHAFEHLFNSGQELLEYLEQTYDPVKLARSIRKENNVYFLALEGVVPVGFVKVKKHSLNEQIESGSQMELQKIYVLPAYQQGGAGSALMKAVKELSKEVYPDHIWLDTHTANNRAIRFYEKNGFKKIGLHHFTIGTQTFEYHVMGLPVAFKIANAC